MEISLTNIGRRYNREWIFRSVDTRFKSGNRYAVLGPNGSGKSTLLSILTGSLTPSEGDICFSLQGKIIEPEDIYSHLSFAAPYLELIENFSLQESIDFHFKFKQLSPKVKDSNALIALLGLEKSKNKPLKFFSSGMRQRTKLALACCSTSPLLILDEPTSNLDQQGIDWYLNLIENYTSDKLLIIGSNQSYEYNFCEHQIQITDYK